MSDLRSLGVITLLAALAAPPALAQQAAPAAGTTAAPNNPPASAPAGVVATTNNPNLAVAALKLENGMRASKIIGAAVYSEQNERVGSVDDLIMTAGDKVTVAIISVGGFLGLGSKLIAVPYPQLRLENDRVVLPGATKESLHGMPSFAY